MGCNSSSSKDVSSTNKVSKKITDPIKIGSVTLKNRIVMAPMTRCRANPEDAIANDLMAEYYSQRAGFGLILTECSQVSPLSNAFPGSAGIYNKEQTEGWKKVVDAVHKKDGKIAIQIWHSGRAVASEFIGGQEPLAPSSIAVSGDHQYTKTPHPVPKEMTLEDIEKVKEEFRQGAKNAKEAGFDAIELHAANGYLVAQFLSSSTNKRTDKYGGSVENRCRFMVEVLDILIEVFGADRTGIRLSLTGRYNDIYDENPLETYKEVFKQIQNKNLAFVELKRHGFVDLTKAAEEGGSVDDKGRTLPSVQMPDYFAQLRPLYKGIIIGNDGFNPETAQQSIDKGEFDLVAFGALAVTNPDLPNRVQNKYELNTSPDYATYFTPGEKGYTDYPNYQAPSTQ